MRRRAGAIKLALFKWLIRDEAIYDVASALRGPDLPIDRMGKDGSVDDVTRLLKGVTTGVVRSLVGLPKRHEGLQVVTMKDARDRWARAPEERRQVARARWERHHHFQHHVRKALLALGADEREAWLLENLTPEETLTR